MEGQALEGDFSEAAAGTSDGGMTYSMIVMGK